MDLNHLHLLKLRALPSRQQNMLRVKGLNTVLIVMLMCSEMGEDYYALRDREMEERRRRAERSEAGGIRSGYFNECT